MAKNILQEDINTQIDTLYQGNRCQGYSRYLPLETGTILNIWGGSRGHMKDIMFLLG